MTSKSYGWDVRNIAEIYPKIAKKTDIFGLFFDFSKTVHTIRLFVFQSFNPFPTPWHQNSRIEMWETQPKLAQKWPNDNKVGNLFINFLFVFDSFTAHAALVLVTYSCLYKYVYKGTTYVYEITRIMTDSATAATTSRHSRQQQQQSAHVMDARSQVSTVTSGWPSFFL